MISWLEYTTINTGLIVTEEDTDSPTSSGITFASPTVSYTITEGEQLELTNTAVEEPMESDFAFVSYSGETKEFWGSSSNFTQSGNAELYTYAATSYQHTSTTRTITEQYFTTTTDTVNAFVWTTGTTPGASFVQVSSTVLDTVQTTTKTTLTQETTTENTSVTNVMTAGPQNIYNTIWQEKTGATKRRLWAKSNVAGSSTYGIEPFGEGANNIDRTTNRILTTTSVSPKAEILTVSPGGGGAYTSPLVLQEVTTGVSYITTESTSASAVEVDSSAFPVSTFVKTVDIFGLPLTSKTTMQSSRVQTVSYGYSYVTGGAMSVYDSDGSHTADKVTIDTQTSMRTFWASVLSAYTTGDGAITWNELQTNYVTTSLLTVNGHVSPNIDETIGGLPAEEFYLTTFNPQQLECKTFMRGNSAQSTNFEKYIQINLPISWRAQGAGADQITKSITAKAFRTRGALQLFPEKIVVNVVTGGNATVALQPPRVSATYSTGTTTTSATALASLEGGSALYEGASRPNLMGGHCHLFETRFIKKNNGAYRDGAGETHTFGGSVETQASSVATSHFVPIPAQVLSGAFPGTHGHLVTYTDGYFGKPFSRELAGAFGFPERWVGFYPEDELLPP
jgi:hypothetical protein